MASTDPQESPEDLPKVLLLKKPPSFQFFEGESFTSTKFQYLKAYESPLPLHQFLAAHAQSVQAVLASGGASINADILQLLPAVRVVVTTSAGLNQIDIPECRRRGIAIANAGDVYSADVADLAVGLLIDVLRKISASDRYVRQGLWATKGDYPLGAKDIKGDGIKKSWRRKDQEMLFYHHSVLGLLKVFRRMTFKDGLCIFGITNNHFFLMIGCGFE